MEDEPRSTAQRPGRPSRSRGFRLAIATLFVLSAVAVAGLLVRFHNYVETSPHFCSTCHTLAPEVAMWTESEHRFLRCQDCHHQTLREGFEILQAYLSGKGPGATHAPVRVASCAGCHASHDTRWPTISNSAGHRIHAEKASVPCTRCHGRQMHFEQPARETCLQCHGDKAGGSSHQATHCLACHDFLSADEVILPTRQDCLACHEKQARPVVVPADAPMQFPCGACHRPHRGNAIVPCSDCHKPRELAGLHGLPGHQDCGACHEAHGWVSTRGHCDSCHENLASHHPGRPCTGCHTFEASLRTGP